MAKKIIQKKGRHFSKEEQHQIIQEMLDKGCTKREIWSKYTGQIEEHGQLNRWMKKLGYPTKEKSLRVLALNYIRTTELLLYRNVTVKYGTPHTTIHLL